MTMAVVVSGRIRGEMYDHFVVRCASEAEVAEADEWMLSYVRNHPRNERGFGESWLWGPNTYSVADDDDIRSLWWNGHEEELAPTWSEFKSWPEYEWVT